ncbi:MAG TPA: Holliday junction resolvase RuvX [Porticoccaceae bacterium]|jgi:putative Holliday junction resolvase|nr:Holliday junction resolvase RuvX [Porticoccaceae bacterium]
MPNLIKPQSVIAFDFGLKQIGVAYGQTLTKNAQGLTIIKAQDGTPQWSVISDLLQEWKPNMLLVGLPLNMDGSESELSGRARKFSRRLEGRYNIDVSMVDERLTSREAKSLLRQQNEEQRKRTNDLTKIDHIAAALILQSWLDDPSLGQPLFSPS